MPLSAFQTHCQIPGLEEVFESFTKLLGRADISPTREALEALLKEGKHGWLSFKEWQERYDHEFRAFDKNGDGFLCKAEMETALKEWYGVSGKTVDLVFHLVDREPETDMLSEEDVYLAMCALVGVRGSISSKTAGATLLEDREDALDDVGITSSGGITKLMVSANTGDTDRLRDLLARGADINARDDYGWTALRYAVRTRNIEVVDMLIDFGADVNLCSKSGRTPLMSAVANNASNIAQRLVESGADIMAKNRDGLTAYDIAKRGGGMGSSIVRDIVNPQYAAA